VSLLPSTRKPWWQQATALVSVSAGGAITGFSFTPNTAADIKSPTSLPIELLALKQAARPAPAPDAMLRSAIVNVANYYLRIADGKSPAEMEAIIWQHDSVDGVDHGASCAAFASLTLELAAQVVGQQSWVTGGTSYPWPLHKWADVRVDPNPSSLGVISIRQDAVAHHRWHQMGDGYRPKPGDWVMFAGHVEVITKYAGGVLHTIGGDSLPNFSVNAHEYPDPLTAQGAVGFVDNGASPATPAGTPGGRAQVPSGQAAQDQAAQGQAPHGQAPHGQAAQGQAAQGQAAQGQAAIPGSAATGSRRPGPARARTPGNADIPGLAAPTPGGGKNRQPERPHTRRAREHTSIGSQPARRAGHRQAAHRAVPREGVPGSATAVRAGAPGTAAIPGLPASTESQFAGPVAPPPATAYRRNQPPPAATPGNETAAQRAFISAVAPGAVAAQRRYGVPAAVTIAQAIEESGWGLSELAIKDHNLFGIKGTGPAGSDPQPTREYEDGQWVTRITLFRVYHNVAECMDDHGRLLASSAYFKRAMAVRQVPNAFAATLTGVYATDPDYGAKLIGLMRRYNLYRYDVAVPTAPSAATPGAATPGAAALGTAAPGAAALGGAAIPGLPRTAPAVPAGTWAPTPLGRATPAPSTQSAADRRLRQASPAPHTVSAKRPPRPANRQPKKATPRKAAARKERYQPQIPPSVRNIFIATAKVPLTREEPLYRDVASHSGIRWELLAACDWMQCEARPRYSPVHGEKLGTVNPDGTVYRTKSEALRQCADDLIELAGTVYRIDVTATDLLSVRDLASAFAAFRWGGLLKLHHTSAMEFPYSVAGLTAQNLNMRWPNIAEPNTPDKPGTRFHMPFGAVPIVLALNYPATV
jgi:flagellum-specific peptidoglycan hydrolase FlgJ